MKHYDKLKALLDEELGDTSLQSEIRFDDNVDSDAEYYEAKIIWPNDKEKNLSFIVNQESITVEAHEDSWYEIDPSDSSIKWFWIALLS